MKQKVWVNTMQKGIANLNNHPNAQVENIIELTQEEMCELFPDGNDSVHMGITHIIEDCILGDIVTLCEVEMGEATYDSPFGVWV